MPRDRLGELQLSNIETTINIGSGTASQGNADMDEFFSEVESIKKGIDCIKQRSQDVEQFHQRALASVDDHSSHDHELDMLMAAVSKEINSVRNRLKAMETENKKSGADASKKDLTAEQRMKLTQQGNLTKKFMEACMIYQKMQKSSKEKFVERVKRQYKIVKPDASQDELKKIAESGDDTSQLFAQQILMGSQLSEVKQALNDIQEKHQDIIKIEKSVIELNQLFMDMSVLVDSQGDMINRIETYVTNAAEHTAKGVNEMRRAVLHQKRARKKMCCIIFVILIAVLIAVLVPVLSNG